MMPTNHSPRRSPRLEASGVPATATTTATATGTATSSASVAGDRQRPQTPKESGTAARKAASNLQPEATGQTTDSTTVVAALMERIARLESELGKARASGGQAEAARDPGGIRARGVGVSGAANTPPCLPAQRLVKALKGEARETVKSLLIYPSNVQAVMEQLRFRYGRPEQLIRSQLESVSEVQPIQEANIARIVPFATKVSNLSAFLQSTATGSQHLANPTLMEELIAKLPLSKRSDWARHAATIQPYPTVAHLSEWLHEFAKLVCTVTDAGAREQPKRRILHANSVREEEQYVDRPRCCPICEGQHQVRDCKDFISASTTTRIESAMKRRLCFSCLEPGHMSRFCRKSRGCNVLGCQMRHHHLLHEVLERSKRPPVADGGHRRDQDRQPYRDGNNRRGVPRSVDSSERNHPTSAAVVDARRERDEGQSAYDRQELPHRNLNIDSIGCHLLFRILPVTLNGENTKVDTYALLDEGSSVTLIDDELIRSLNLKGESRQLNVQWFGGKSAKEHTKVVSLQISAAGKPKRHGLKNVYGVANLNLPMQSLRQEDVQAVKANTRLPVMPYNNATPRILIGLDHAHLGVPFRTKSYGSGGPFAAETALGWVVYGPVNGKPSSPLLSSCLLAVPQDDLLEKMISDYFETENFEAKTVQPVAAGRVDLEPSVGDSGDARALSTLEKTTKRVGQRYETGLLWKDDEVRLPESYSMALRRLVNIERKMKRDVDFASAYIRIMDDYVKKGYARRLEAQEVQRFQEGKVWYLPHFEVENPNKPRKIRLVFDAAAKVDGVSLNSALLKGPQRYKPLPAVLFHFREGAVGVCADIKEMFHQVLMQPKDRCAQSSTDPRAALAINEYHYVDDYVDSFASEDEAIAISTRVREIHAEAGFDLCRFTSSSASVVRALNPLESIASIGWTEAEEKVLGMYWQPATDDFKFGVKYHRVPRNVMTGERVPTKREFLSLVMSTFDTIGFLSCYMVTAKLLLREIWRRGVNWDEPLPDELAAAFEDWRQGMSRIQEFRCPRHYFGGGRVRTLQLHIFVDPPDIQTVRRKPGGGDFGIDEASWKRCSPGRMEYLVEQRCGLPIEPRRLCVPLRS
ncbi:uncharacterized protein LOC121529787 [Drosophila eugracilis]|uniref:uncharacterized protein LOC121529787 n=1 Tax=Drosophila eugracilis TaxID=29029 RepID=UPI001BDAB779|nr:uncharacterized protein LOC121529787 [Drosophila eugracilis]